MSGVNHAKKYRKRGAVAAARMALGNMPRESFYRLLRESGSSVVAARLRVVAEAARKRGDEDEAQRITELAGHFCGMGC